MSITIGSRKAFDQNRLNAASVPLGVSDPAYLKAKAILRQEDALTIEQFEELDQLLRTFSLPQFVALTKDPDHQRQLHSYEAMSWRRLRPVGLFLLVAFIASVLAGMFLVLSS